MVVDGRSLISTGEGGGIELKGRRYHILARSDGNGVLNYHRGKGRVVHWGEVLDKGVGVGS